MEGPLYINFYVYLYLSTVLYLCQVTSFRGGLIFANFPFSQNREFRTLRILFAVYKIIPSISDVQNEDTVTKL